MLRTKPLCSQDAYNRPLVRGPQQALLGALLFFFILFFVGAYNRPLIRGLQQALLGSLLGAWRTGHSGNLAFNGCKAGATGRET